LQPTRRVFHSTAIQSSSRVRISSYKVINYYSPIHPPSRRHPDPVPGHRELSVTPTASASPWRRITRAVFPPPCVPSRANPSGLGHAATILLVGPGTPRGRNADKTKKRVTSNFSSLQTGYHIMGTWRTTRENSDTTRVVWDAIG
jgi:hypothetical protein